MCFGILYCKACCKAYSAAALCFKGTDCKGMLQQHSVQRRGPRVCTLYRRVARHLVARAVRAKECVAGRGQGMAVEEEEGSSSGSLDHPGLAAPRRQRAAGGRPATAPAPDPTKNRLHTTASLINPKVTVKTSGYHLYTAQSMTETFPKAKQRSTS